MQSAPASAMQTGASKALHLQPSAQSPMVNQTD
jgi:hypothetical protein